MKKKPILLENFKKDQGSTKERCPSNVLIVEKLGSFKTNDIILRNTLKMKMTQIHNKRKRENPTIRKIITKEKIIITQNKRTSFHMSLVRMIVNSFS